MDRQAIINELTGEIVDYLKNQGLELVDLIYRYEGKNLILRILADRPEGGIRLDECARLNNEIGMILDEKNLLQERYLLEVSSPGIDRPLKTKDDFARCMNRRIRFFLHELVKGKMELEGVINKLENESVYIDIGTEIVEIPLPKISKAKQIF